MNPGLFSHLNDLYKTIMLYLLQFLLKEFTGKNQQVLYVKGDKLQKG